MKYMHTYKEDMPNEPDKWHWQERGTAWKGAGIYHVTMVIPSREPLLGKLVIPENDPTQARVEATELGKKIVAIMFKISDFHPEVRLLQYCLMPDHLHTILYVTHQMPQGIRTVVRGFWQGAKKIGRQYSLSVHPNNIRNNERNSDNPNNIRDNERNLAVDPVFTEMPFIRPMSRRGQLQAMFRYVQMNPQRLATKRLMPGFFRVQSGIEISGRTYSGVGNVALLQAGCFAPVHVRRTMVEVAECGDNQPLRDYMNGCVVAARNGTVMVSPFISPQERQVMEVLLKEKLPFIYLADNGFREYYKPQDNLFDACATGNLLILSPWEYDAGKRHITRNDCVMLNNMAEEIADECKKQVEPKCQHSLKSKPTINRR